jgi:hypothetical protein
MGLIRKNKARRSRPLSRYDAPGKSQVIRLRLSNFTPGKNRPFSEFDDIMELRHKEADEFYDTDRRNALFPE